MSDREPLDFDAAWSRLTVGELLARQPAVGDFLASLGAGAAPPRETMEELAAGLDPEALRDRGVEPDELPARFRSFLAWMTRLAAPPAAAVESVTVIGGRDKTGRAEDFTLTLVPGEVTSIVGPTGSGKSRFLADIEWLAQGDTPTGRRVLVNGAVPDPARRYAVEQKLVAQLSQNMNFVMDLSVRDFVHMHAESRMADDPAGVAETVIALANELAGERFAGDTPLTSLSGGQSRALMIADTACLSLSPIVLIDEIENAGIDRRRALALLADKRKIVLMATHDPILALMGSRRLVFRNGGIARVIETTERERANLAELEALDRRLTAVRTALRSGETIDAIDHS
ncbi:ATP-binding cassette domain-containing protein [Geobacter sp.]|uniref:ATP-binding cassette domain-containing protein n=1 Tax=Geobacter sp. TaxID=46610 RepID=UPI0026319AA7|nr:ATP-binding cassette domain-containing protein [Geobacter sp.]